MKCDPMTAIMPDAPRVAVFPPLLPAASIGASLVLQWRCPLGLYKGAPDLQRLTAGLVLLAVGAALLVSGLRALRRHHTNVLPSRPALELVENGVFRWTRNPMYVGGSIALLACALLFALDWLPLLAIVSFVALHFAIIRREEAYLERAFGARYLQYKARTPRYLGF
jgi:protein-S-isoprenylcysteine O-methyltransferase Ste14